MLIEDEPEDLPDEEVPLKLRKKWDTDPPDETQKCASCGREAAADSVLCLYCGESTGRTAGFLSRIRRFFSASKLGIILFLALFIGILLLLLR